MHGCFSEYNLKTGARLQNQTGLSLIEISGKFDENQLTSKQVSGPPSSPAMASTLSS